VTPDLHDDRGIGDGALGASEGSQWFSVRCLFHHAQLSTFEERITLWRAASFDDAILQAEREAREYANALGAVSYLGLAQSFQLYDPPGAGTEVFSLMRASILDPETYLSQYFVTGQERQHETG
jgi:hypothetical protein